MKGNAGVKYICYLSVKRKMALRKTVHWTENNIASPKLGIPHKNVKQMWLLYHTSILKTDEKKLNGQVICENVSWYIRAVAELTRIDKESVYQILHVTIKMKNPGSFTVLDHPFYSPSIASCDLFQKVKW